MGIRKQAHWAKPDPRECLIDDINEWVQQMTGDTADGIPGNTRMTRDELQTICRAISYARDKYR